MRLLKNWLFKRMRFETELMFQIKIFKIFKELEING